MQLPIRVLYYGVDNPLPEVRTLRAGPVTAELEEGRLRYVRLSSPTSRSNESHQEIIRHIYVAVRDRYWNTPQPHLRNMQIEQDEDSFKVTFEAEHIAGDINFYWKGTITGDEKGSIRYEMDGQARSTFLRNRIGICVLHPLEECAGHPYTVIHSDGSTESGVLPLQISPHQPVFDIRTISYGITSGVTARIDFEGEIFEMEDQRNWTDASFKTYSTPLALPIPVEVREGEVVRQAITITLQGEKLTPSPTFARLTGEGVSRGLGGEITPESRPEGEVISLVIGSTPTGRVPRLGLGMATEDRPLTRPAGHMPWSDNRRVRRLRALQPAHLRVDLRLWEPGFPALLQRAALEARALGTTLEAALFLSDKGEEELRSLVEALQMARPKVSAWLVFHQDETVTSRKWLDLARQRLSGYSPQARFGGGTNHYFTELNRNRPQPEGLDLVAYSANPQVHTFDNTSLAENLEGQAWQIESARAFMGHVPIAVSPITLRPRFNPGKGSVQMEPGQLPSDVDPRQMSLFGAAWTLGSLKYVAEAGAYSATYYETAGWKGVLQDREGSPAPGLFPSLPDMVYPPYHVLADVMEMAGAEVLPMESSHSLQAVGIALHREGKPRALAANLTARPLWIRIAGLPGKVRVRLLDETTAYQAMQDPEAYRSAAGEERDAQGGRIELELRPYAVVCLDGV